MRSETNGEKTLRGYNDFVSLDDSLYDRHIGPALAEITMNWARVEYWLYSVLEPIDSDNAAIWVAEFFKNVPLEKKKAAIRREISNRADLDSEYLTRLDAAFKILEAVTMRRNLLAHGLWLRDKQDRKVFRVQPLRLRSDKKVLEPIMVVDLKFLTELSRDIKRAIDRLASLSAEIMAHDFLAKRSAVKN